MIKRRTSRKKAMLLNQHPQNHSKSIIAFTLRRQYLPDDRNPPPLELHLHTTLLSLNPRIYSIFSLDNQVGMHKNQHPLYPH